LCILHFPFCSTIKPAFLVAGFTGMISEGEGARGKSEKGKGKKEKGKEEMDCTIARLRDFRSISAPSPNPNPNPNT